MKAMLNFSKVEREILKTLMTASKDVNLFTLHRRYQTSPRELTKAVQSLNRKKFVKVDENNIKLTKQGRILAIKNRFDIVSQREKPWRECPKEFMKEKIGVNEPYIPLQSKLDRNLKVQ
jgi:predicted methyltransferase